jgi:hypothetical protein
LFLDAQFVPDLIHLLYTTYSLKDFTFGIIFGLILLAGVTVGIWLSFKTIHSFLAYHRNRRSVVGLIATGLILLSYMPDGGIRIPGEAFGVKSTVDFYKILPKVKRRLDPYILVILGNLVHFRHPYIVLYQHVKTRD